jgi:phthalate 4,5-cis-dihydrodiol dehydrogenase
VCLAVRVISRLTSKIIEPVRVGVVGLGRGFTLTAPSALESELVKFVAASAPRDESRKAFQSVFQGRAYSSYDQLLSDPSVEAIHIATPHQLHAEMTVAAAEAGKHVLVEKPIAVSLTDAERMVAACETNQVTLIVGPAHSFDRPVLAARQMIDSGEFGRVLAINTLNYTDFMYRPRRDEELRTVDGGGVLFSQGAHQFDIVRLLAGAPVSEVYASTGLWDKDRNTEISYQAMIRFTNGAVAQCTYSGFARFDSDELMSWVGETGHEKDPGDYGNSRRALVDLTRDGELSAKRSRTFGASKLPTVAPNNEHFGPLIIQCEGADLRVGPREIGVYTDFEKKVVPVPMVKGPREPVFRALYDAVRSGTCPIQSGRWCLGTLEVCHAVIESAKNGKPVYLKRS